jgi:hypothetical protein
MKKIVVLLLLSVGVFFALHVGYRSVNVVEEQQVSISNEADAQQAMQTVRTIFNNVWDKANQRLMTTPGVGAQGVFETTETIMNNVWDQANNMLRTSGGGGGSGDFSSNTATSVDSEVVLFSGTAGKTGKRATGTGVAHLTSGVLSVSNVLLASEVTGALPLANGGGLTTAIDDNVVIGNGTILQSKALPDCADGVGHLNYSTATNTLSCGTSAATGDVTAVGSCTTGACFTSGTPAASLVFNNATSGTATLQTVTGALGTVTVSLPAASDTLVGKATVDVLTNKTFDVEGTGNVFTSVHKVWLPAAVCQGTVATLLWDTYTADTPSATCLTDSNVTKGVADFPDSVAKSMQLSFPLPDDFVGVMSAKFKWSSASITGNIQWFIYIACVADGEDDNPEMVAISSVIDTAKGTAGVLNDASIATVSTTGCAAGELMHFMVKRDSQVGNGSDTLAGTGSLIGVELTLRRAQ